MRTDVLIWMDLEIDLDRSKHGFGGDSPRSEPPDNAGPFTERGKTIEQLLTLIVSSSHGASWYPTGGALGTSFLSSINRFWTLASYSSPNLIRPH
jgi:hypothetical protein